MYMFILFYVVFRGKQFVVTNWPGLDVRRSVRVFREV